MCINIGVRMENIVQLARDEYTYNAETGEFKRTKGRQVKATGNTGLRVAGKKIVRSKLAWMIHYGEIPLNLLKYVDGDESNCAINNLQLRNKRPKHIGQAQSRIDAKLVIAEMIDTIAKGYDESEYRAVTICSGNKKKLIPLGYELPVGVNYKWLVKIDDLIEIGSNEVVTVTCTGCKKTRKTKAYRGKLKCKSCSKTGVKHTEEHRRNNSEAKVAHYKKNGHHRTGYKYESVESHPSYNPDISDEDRVSRRSYRNNVEWSLKVKENA